MTKLTYKRLGVQMNFESLVGHINQVQDVLQAQAAHAVNLSLTARNWLVGYYIVEYEQHGEDRARYGDNLINRLAKDINRKGFEPRRLREYRQIYIVYPQLGTSIASYLQKNSKELPASGALSIWQTASAKLQTPENQVNEIWQSAIAKLEEWSTPADLKIDRFRHEYASQLNLYMNYYKHEVMQTDDNPPIGLLLCTEYGVTTVQYATEGPYRYCYKP